MTAPEVSHGRGGAGNINPDDTQYVDGEVVRVGAEGSHGDGAFSTGRGGAANIGDAGTKQGVRADKDLVPEAAVRPSHDSDHHTGRGGAGNEHHVAKKDNKPEGEGKPTAPIGLADKLKYKIFGAFKK
ncbi:be5e5828-f3b4-417c-8652-b42568bbaa98 [Thermothielavioides terrestris]|uniref:Uncharacterized protein n=2 Tax=Thermothielavioides terrestris TaxID=2587410 RepID=G2R550_THETT|nr:uncharacterized protein THITE_2114000 [Thermothielavioides terrestris NRRL 8126]AEO66133.1 hypothetical protein THITE_2114000 [Thermothielavioides terrestris NRRL 8126]SPQ18607.1 be5e5828-f3b4-417c-8652-b42568bbaa98 [Thermothielavioides terrestris]